MFGNYLPVTHFVKIAWRNILKNKLYSFINIGGLAVGMAAFLLIVLYIREETSYDKHHAESDRIFRIASNVKDKKWVGTGAVYAAALKNEFPEVESVTRLLRFPGAEKMLLLDNASQKKFFETNAFFVDSTFLSMFKFESKYGDISSALNVPNTIVISEDIANKFFNHENPINKSLKVVLPFGDQDYIIKGVWVNKGSKSHIPVKMLLSMNNGHINGFVNSQSTWSGNNIFHTYVKLTKDTKPEAFESKLTTWLYKHGGKEFETAGFDKSLFIQPVEDIYLRSNFGFEIATNGNMNSIYLFASLAFFILLIACINFMNLSTAESEKRAKEVGLRKSIGADKKSLIVQFLGESVLMSSLALLVSIGIISFVTPNFNSWFGKSISLFQTPHFVLWLIMITFITGILSGLYPALFLSSFKPITVLKGSVKNSTSTVVIRKGLVVFQFTISIILILGVILMQKQMIFLSIQSLGFNKNQKLVIPIQNTESIKNLTSLKNELKNQSFISDIAVGSASPGIETINSIGFYAEGKNARESIDTRTIYADDGYLKTLDIKLIAGREFKNDISSEQGSIILNESAINNLGYTIETAVGKKVNFDFNNETQSMEIVGIVADYNFESLQQRIKPLALTVNDFFSMPLRYIIASVNNTNYSASVKSVSEIWNTVNPSSPFEYSFVDKDFEQNYKSDTQNSILLKIFTLLAAFISCLGLFGLASFVAEQRTKEIGVRKVLGASVTSLWQMLSKDFVVLVLLSCLIAAPIAYYFMNSWLQKYTYRTEISWWIFVVAGAGSLVITLLTVSFQAIKAAIANPINSLKTE